MTVNNQLKILMCENRRGDEVGEAKEDCDEALDDASGGGERSRRVDAEIAAVRVEQKASRAERLAGRALLVSVAGLEQNARAHLEGTLRGGGACSRRRRTRRLLALDGDRVLSSSALALRRPPRVRLGLRRDDSRDASCRRGHLSQQLVRRCRCDRRSSCRVRLVLSGGPTSGGSARERGALEALEEDVEQVARPRAAVAPRHAHRHVSAEQHPSRLLIRVLLLYE